MAQDPYGFKDSGPVALDATGASADATRAMQLALCSALLGSVGVCFCYVPYLIALPMSVYAAFLGNRALRAVTTEEGRALANGGLVGGILAACVSAIFSLFFLLYLGIMVVYFGAIVAVLGAASTQQ